MDFQATPAGDPEARMCLENHWALRNSLSLSKSPPRKESKKAYNKKISSKEKKPCEELPRIDLEDSYTCTLNRSGKDLQDNENHLKDEALASESESQSSEPNQAPSSRQTHANFLRSRPAAPGERQGVQKQR